MEGKNTFWLVNSVYNDVREFHFSSNECSFVVYFRGETPLFVLDNTCDKISPNNLLVIEALPEEEDARKPKIKWDSILKNNYKIDPLKIRPKENTKYKKLDISYNDLSLYKQFAFSLDDDFLDSIMRKRELLSLENAYEREAENLLNYNKSTQTIEKATVTLENLKKKIQHLSKRLKRQNEIEASKPEKVNESLKAELIKKMYENTEKLKRTERRIKRAKKRSANAFTNLSLNRSQIQEIKFRIEKRETNLSEQNLPQKEQIQNVTAQTLPPENKTEQGKILSRFNYPDSLSSFNTDSLTVMNDENKKNKENQDVENGKIEKLTTENINAKNEVGEKIETNLPQGEDIMEKDTEKDLKTTTEFKPPFVDDTALETPKTEVNPDSQDIRFAKKISPFRDNYKKVRVYAVSIIVSLIIVLGLFLMLSNKSNEKGIENSSVEQYVEVVETAPVTPAEESPAEPEMLVSEPEESPAEPEMPVSEPEESPAEPEMPVSEPEESPVEQVDFIEEVAPVSEPEPVYVEPSPAPTSKTVVENKKELTKKVEQVKKQVVQPQPQVKNDVKPETKVIPVKKEVSLVNIPEEDENLDSYEEESDEMEDDAEPTVEISALEISRKDYVENVMAGDSYISLISSIKNRFFNLEDEHEIGELSEMIRYWNNFRNMTYDAYYENDYTLKPNINYEEYAKDEYLLRLFTNEYYGLYEYIVNEFVMKYEYANSTATDLYSSIENELDVLGHPVTKLEILAKIANAIREQGGPEAVLAAISVKDEEETSIADNMEIEATLVPLSVTTEIVYEENIYSSDDTEIVNQDSTEVVTDFTEEYDNSNDIVTISPVISEDEEISNEGNDVEVVETEMIPPKENDEETSDENETVITNADVVEEEVATQAPANLDISVSEPEEEELIGDNNDTKNMETSSDDEEELVASEEENEENNEDNEVVENDTDDDYFENEDENAEDDTEFSDSEEEVTVFEEEV